MTDPSARFAVQDTSFVDLQEARAGSILSDVKEDYTGRTFTIFKPSQSAMTSGTSSSQHWAVKANNVDKWSNQLMGWLSSTDTLQTPMAATRFESAEQAILFCERNGLTWELQVPHERTAIAVDNKTLGNQYSYNFLTLEVQANLKKAGARKARHMYTHPEAPMKGGVSTWVNHKKTAFGPDSWRPRTDIGQGGSAWTGPEWKPK